jgi:hypothetical protein
MNGMSKTENIRLLDGDVYHIPLLLHSMQDDDFYYGDLSRLALSSTAVSKLLESPKVYKRSLNVGDDSEQDHYRMGRLVHTACNEPHMIAQRFQIIDGSSRASQTFLRAQYELAKKNLETRQKVQLITSKEFEHGMRIADAVTQNEHVMHLMDGCEFEVPHMVEIEGYPFRLKSDMEHPGFLADLKTTRNISDFETKAELYNYDAQAFIYCTGTQTEPEDYKIIAVDKDTYDVAIFDITQSFLNKGYAKVKEAIHRYRTFFQEGNDLNSYTLRGTLI